MTETHSGQGIDGVDTAIQFKGRGEGHEVIAAVLIVYCMADFFRIFQLLPADPVSDFIPDRSPAALPVGKHVLHQVTEIFGSQNILNMFAVFNRISYTPFRGKTGVGDENIPGAIQIGHRAVAQVLQHFMSVRLMQDLCKFSGFEVVEKLLFCLLIFKCRIQMIVSQQTQIVVSQYRHNSITVSEQKIERFHRFGASADHITGGEQDIGCRIEGDLFKQKLQLVITAVNITDAVGTHVMIPAAPPECWPVLQTAQW